MGANLLYGGIAVCFLNLASCNHKPSSRPLNVSDMLRQEPVVIEDTVAIPECYSKTSEAKGDLDGDQIPETAIVLSKGGNEGREIQLFKYKQGEWKLWHTSVGAVLPGTLNTIEVDPIGHISIEDKLLTIWHSTQTSIDGGVSFIHKYQYLDQKWQLVFVESNSSIYSIKDEGTLYGECTYDLVTGKVSYVQKKEEDADGKYKIIIIQKRDFVVKMKELPLMDGFIPGKHKLQEINEIYY